MVSWIWPADFPEDCPPDEADPADESYYRIVKSDPPETSDFVSLYHQNSRLADRNIISGRATKCETMGLSTYTDKGQALECARQFPQLGDKIARLTLKNDAGQVLATPRGVGDTHHTWWKAEGFDPIGSAKVVTSWR